MDGKVIDLTVGVIGLGSMGLAMADNIVDAGFSVRGYDIADSAREALRNVGGRPVDSAAEAATDADVLLLMVVNAEQANSSAVPSGRSCSGAAAGVDGRPVFDRGTGSGKIAR